jgi:hypothetical protein
MTPSPHQRTFSTFLQRLAQHSSWIMSREVEVNGLHHPPAPAEEQLKNNDSPNGWIVQKFGGTSVGKLPVNIAEDIVRYAPNLTAEIAIGTE